MNTKFCLEGTSGSTSKRRASAVALRKSLAAFVTAATLIGGCGDGSSEQGGPQVSPGEQGPGALVAGSSGFRCRPWIKGSCGKAGGSSGAGGAPVDGGGGYGGSAVVGAGGAAGVPADSVPFTILAPATSPVAVTTDGTAVVWVEPTAVRSCPISGCGSTGAPAPINASPISDPVVDAVALDQASVYWLSQNLVQRCPLSGCADNETFASTPPDAVGVWRELAVHGGVVYGETKTMVYECPVGGCARPSPVFGSPDDNGTPFAVDDTGVFTSITGEGFGTYYCPSGACPATLGAPLATPGGVHLAAVNGTVYMWDVYGNITSCASSGCPGGPTTLATGQATLTSLKADASGVYWTTSDGTTGSVLTCALPGCAGGPRSLATNQANPVSLAVSAHYVVWANEGSGSTAGSIMGIAK